MNQPSTAARKHLSRDRRPGHRQTAATASIDQFRTDVLRGLSSAPKSLACKYLYDERGSQLFDRICELDEYYPTRTELAILRESAAEIVQLLGDQVRLVEFGSGSSHKTRVLLDHARKLTRYMPVDISGDYLEKVAATLRKRYPRLQIEPVVADFTHLAQLPDDAQQHERTVVFFPGSTIGNFTPHEAAHLLRNIHSLCGPDGGLLIGIDLQKSHALLEAAYDDAEGVTAEFTLNLLRRINRELDADFQLDQFAHQANYNPLDGRIEISLVSQIAQRVAVAGQAISLSKAESIHVEYSYKYQIHEFARFARRAGWQLNCQWTDAKDFFAVLYFHAVDCQSLTDIDALAHNGQRSCRSAAPR